MTSQFVRGSNPSRYISPSKRGFAQFIIPLLLAAQVVFVLQPIQTNAHSAYSAQELKEVRQLEVGKPIEREMAGGENHTYEIALADGQYLNVVVEQRGIDVVVRLLGPDSKQLIEIDSPNGTQGPERLMTITRASGVYRLEVRSLEKDAKAGRYEVQITELRTATEEDRAWVEALKLRDESLRLSEEGKFDDALLPAERAVIILEKAFGANHQKIVPALSNLASVYHSKGDYAKVEQLDLRALVIFEEALGPEHPRVANILINIARTNFTGHWRK